MDKNKELVENVYNACKQWIDNFNCPLDEIEKRRVIFFVGMFKLQKNLQKGI